MIPVPNWELERLVYEERSRAAQARRFAWMQAAARRAHPLRGAAASSQLRNAVAQALYWLAAKVEPSHSAFWW